jgi:hypothetical protein
MTSQGFALLKNPKPTRCEACGPDVSPHDATMLLVCKVEFLRIRRAVCERRALAEGLERMERGSVLDSDLLEAAEETIAQLRERIAQLEIDNEHMGQEIQQAHTALGEWDARATALENN